MGVGDDCHIITFRDHTCLPKRHRVWGDLTFNGVEKLMLEEQDGVVVPDRGAKQMVRIRRIGRRHDLQPRSVHEKGLRALGFAPTQPTYVRITLTGEVDQTTEEAIQRRLETIASRAGMEVKNRMANARENARRQRQTELVLLGVIILFFAVAVSMQVSSASRRIRADQRMIGTLRAVGADEKALMGCYRLPLLVTTAAGLLLALCLFILMGTAAYHYFLAGHHLVLMLPLMICMAALCALCCMAGIRGRLRQVLSKSVVENIREL